MKSCVIKLTIRYKADKIHDQPKIPDCVLGEPGLSVARCTILARSIR